MARKKLFLGIVILGIFFLSFSTASAQIIETVFSENWESGPGNWDVSNGVGQVGAPTAGPGGAHGGSQCAGTVLDGNYPNNTDSRLISPSIRLSQVSGDEEIHLRFWHWFSFARGMPAMSRYQCMMRWRRNGRPGMTSMAPYWRFLLSGHRKSCPSLRMQVKK